MEQTTAVSRTILSPESCVRSGPAIQNMPGEITIIAETLMDQRHQSGVSLMTMIGKNVKVSN